MSGRCENCGWTKKDHRQGKCPSKIRNTCWKPWTVQVKLVSAIGALVAKGDSDARD